MLGAPPFHPGPDDFGPLQPGEARELIRFARDRVPEVFRAIQRFRGRPGDQQRHLQRIAPRLRHLRRLFDDDPVLARQVVRYMDNRLVLDHRARHAWRRASPAERERIEDRLRERIAENLRIEIEVLNGRIERIENSREQIVQQMEEILLDPQTDLSGEPPALRRVAEQLRSSAEGMQPDSQPGAQAAGRGPDALLGRLRQMCGRRIDAELDGLRRRRAQMQDSSEEIVERQLSRLIDAYERGGRIRGPVGPPP